MLTQYEAETMRREARRYFSPVPWTIFKCAVAALALIVALIFGVDAMRDTGRVQTAATAKDVTPAYVQETAATQDSAAALDPPYVFETPARAQTF